MRRKHSRKDNSKQENKEDNTMREPAYENHKASIINVIPTNGESECFIIREKTHCCEQKIHKQTTSLCDSGHCTASGREKMVDEWLNGQHSGKRDLMKYKNYHDADLD